jgi:hypothetical protein
VPGGPIGLTSNNPFAIYSAYVDGSGLHSGEGGVTFTYSAADNSYTVQLPGFNAGKLVTEGGNGSVSETGEWIHLDSTTNNVTDGNSAALQGVYVILDYAPSSELKYTSFASWWDQGNYGYPVGVFAYGIPTAAGDVPTVGAASYAGTIHGITDSTVPVGGNIAFNFDFAAGTLSGKMTPEYYPFWDAIGLGTYTFANTVYAKGSTTFSGSFSLPPGVAGPSSFQGRFNGPQAAELMGSWMAPFVDTVNNVHGNMGGVFVGKKGP